MSLSEDLFNNLGEEYQQNDVVLGHILQILEPSLQPVETAFNTIETHFDHDLMPDRNLDWALRAVGWAVLPNLTVYTKREALKKVKTWKRTYGLPTMLEDVFNTYTKASSGATGITVLLEVRKTNPGGFRIGKSRIGKGRIWQEFTNNFILITVTSAGSVAWNTARETQVRGLVEQFLPPWMDYKLIPPA
jgi:hypothetical protein